MRILFAEDEKALNEAVSTILIRNNYSVDSVYDGEETLDYIAVTDYDIIILDIMMPKIDGLSVLKKIRQNKNKTPVIMLTAKSEVDDKIKGLDLGADDYLTKPFATNELLARLRAISRRTNDISENNICVGNIKLNRSSFELSSDDSSEIFTLGSKEYQILELLLSNPKKIFTANNLMDKIWGYDIDTDISVVWVYISNIRKRLKSLNSSISIKNKRNLGYYLEIKND